MIRALAVLVVAVAVLAPLAAGATDYTISVPDDSGVTWARKQYNATQAADKTLATNQDYLQFIIDEAAQGYTRSMKVAPLDAARAKCVSAGDCADAGKINAAAGAVK